MAKHLNEIFTHERGSSLNEALRNNNNDLANVISKKIAEDLADFIAKKKWNNITLEVDIPSAKFKTHMSIPILEIKVRSSDKIDNTMELIDAISDVEDLIDSVIHDREKFDGIYVSLGS